MNNLPKGFRYWAQDWLKNGQIIINDNKIYPKVDTEKIKARIEEALAEYKKKVCKHFWQPDMNIVTLEFVKTCPKCGAVKEKVSE